MDQGRRWALETFGQYGPLIRQQVPELVREEHEASLDAQEASGHRSQGVYGEYWRGILEKFEEFGRLPGATMVRPGLAPYRLPVVNGVALFPWRYSKSQQTEFTTTRFGTSDARIAMFRLRVTAIQGTFDLGLPDDQLTDEERDLLATLEAVANDPAVTSGKLVVVAIASSPRGLFAVEWGQVTLGSDGYPAWTGFHENLRSLPRLSLASASPAGTFASGEPPAKFIRARTSDAPSGTGDG